MPVHFPPAVRIEVGTGHGTQGLPGCRVRSTYIKIDKIIYEGDNWFFSFPRPDTKLTIDKINSRLGVEIKNETSVPLTVITKIGKDELVDWLNHGKTIDIHPRADTVTIEA